MSEHPAVVFLRQAHEQAEELARDATPGPWESEDGDLTDDEVFTVHDGKHGDLVGNPVAYVRDGTWGRAGEGRTQANMRLIASFADPTAVLRRVAAERELLAEHQSTRGMGYDQGAHGNWVAMTACSSCGVSDEFGVPWPCRTVLLLAKAWGWEEES